MTTPEDDNLTREELSARIEAGRTFAKRLQDQLREAYYTFESVGSVLEQLERLGVTDRGLNEKLEADSFRLPVREFDDQLSTLLLKCGTYIVELQQASASDTQLHEPVHVEVLSDDDATIRSHLFTASRVLSDVSEEVVKCTPVGSAKRDHFLDEILKAWEIINALASSLKGAEPGPKAVM